MTSHHPCMPRILIHVSDYDAMSSSLCRLRLWQQNVWMLLLSLLVGVSTGSESTKSEADYAAFTKVAELAYISEIKPLLTTYCVKCHGGEKTKGEVNFSAIRGGAAAMELRELWIKSADQLHHQEMPPQKEKQPSSEEAKKIIVWINALKQGDRPDAGRVTIRRLNRAEYNNTMRDLIGIDVKPADKFPHDDIGEGFDNIADILSLSPLLLEKYLLAANGILDQVIVDDQVKLVYAAGEMSAIIDGKNEVGKQVTGAIGAISESASQRKFMVPGEIYTMFSVPKLGKYTFKIKAGAEQAGTDPARLAVKVDGQVVTEIKVLASTKSPATYSASVTLSPGYKRLSVIFTNPFTEASEKTTVLPMPPGDKKKKPQPKKPAEATEPAKPTTPPRVRAVVFDAVEIIGPPAAPITELHKRIFVSAPSKELSAREAARTIVTSFATRAFRKPVTQEQVELHLKVFDLADQRGELFSESVKLMIKSVLVSPQFFFRMEDEQKGDHNGNYRIIDWELASRLSYFLWSSMPDEELFTLAKEGKLHEPSIIEAQVRRMIADPKARSLVDNFSGQWLQLRNVFSVTPDERLFPELNQGLRQAMYDEGALLFQSILQEGRSLIEFIDADFTFLNEPLARHYGISGISGSQMRKVQLNDRNRGGLVTMASILTVTSNPTRTSPVKRGKWVMEQILGIPPLPPPPMVDGLKESEDGNVQILSLRQQMEKHRADPVCAGCHKVMDQIGFGLEKFDAVGRWRERYSDTNAAVDASGELPGEQRFNGPAELKKLFLTRKDDFARCLTEKLLTYALGRRLTAADDEAIERIVSATIKDGYKFDRLIIELTKSFPFQFRRQAR